jgi:hypothetical protein
MLEPNQLSITRPQGEAEIAPVPVASPGAVETFGGKIFVRWDPAARVTAFGPVTYRVSENQRSMGELVGVSVALPQPECAAQGRHSGDLAAGRVGRP